MSRASRARPALRLALAVGMVGIGVLHFVRPEPFARIVPPWLPAAHALVLISGGFEVLGGAGLLVPRARRAASYGLVLLYLAVFPANIHMAVNHVTLGHDIPAWALWARLPLQAVLIAWALWAGRDDRGQALTATARLA